LNERTSEILFGQIIVGGCASTTVIVNEQVAMLDDGSVAVHAMVVVPTGNCETPFIPQDTVTVPLLSVAVAGLQARVPVFEFADVIIL